jgi:hypothetical protein
LPQRRQLQVPELRQIPEQQSALAMHATPLAMQQLPPLHW